MSAANFDLVLHAYAAMTVGAGTALRLSGRTLLLQLIIIASLSLTAGLLIVNEVAVPRALDLDVLDHVGVQGLLWVASASLIVGWSRYQIGRAETRWSRLGIPAWRALVPWLALPIGYVILAFLAQSATGACKLYSVHATLKQCTIVSADRPLAGALLWAGASVLAAPVLLAIPLIGINAPNPYRTAWRLFANNWWRLIPNLAGALLPIYVLWRLIDWGQDSELTYMLYSIGVALAFGGVASRLCREELEPSSLLPTPPAPAP
jgi:hypothetical protein